MIAYIEPMIGKRIMAERKSRGLTRRDLARVARTTEANISYLERDLTKNPTGAMLQAIADLLKVNVSWLIDGREPRVNVGQLSTEAAEVAEIYDALSERQRQRIRDAIITVAQEDHQPDPDITPLTHIVRRLRERKAQR